MLSNLSDIELINRVKQQQCDESFKELRNRHEKLYYDMFHKYKKYILEKRLVTDVKDDLVVNFYEAIHAFDPSKNVKFSTYLANTVKYKSLKEINKDKYLMVSMSETENHDFPCYAATDRNDNYYNGDFSNKKDLGLLSDHLLGSISNPRTKKVFLLRFFSKDTKNLPWANIGEQIGVTGQQALNIFNKELKRIKKEIKILVGQIP